MKRILLASVFSGALFVAACTTPEISDAQAVVTDAQTILATGLIPPPVSTIAALVVAGLQALVDSAGASVTSGANAESTALAALTAAVTQVKTNSTAGTTVYNAATAALAALATISANTSASAQAQIEAAVGTVLIDYLEENAPVSAVPGAAPSAVQKAINDARAHISNLQLVH